MPERPSRPRRRVAPDPATPNRRHCRYTIPLKNRGGALRPAGSLRARPKSEKRRYGQSWNVTWHHIDTRIHGADKSKLEISQRWPSASRLGTPNPPAEGMVKKVKKELDTRFSVVVYYISMLLRMHFTGGVASESCQLEKLSLKPSARKRFPDTCTMRSLP